MLLRKFQIFGIHSQLAKYCSSASSKSTVVQLSSTKVHTSPFNAEQELIIVKTINQCTAADFIKYDIKEDQLKRLIDFRDRNGFFTTLDDVLLSQNVPTLVKLCKSIIEGGKKTTLRKQTPINDVIKKCAVIPPLDLEIRQSIKNIVSFRVWGTKISWIHIDENNYLSHWRCEELQTSSKPNLLSLVNLIIDIVSKIPQANAYVMQADGYVALSKLKTAAYGFHLQRQQIISMMIALLGVRSQSLQNGITNITNIYSISMNAASQIFQLKVGSESMSSESLVLDILAGKNLRDIVPNCPMVSVDEETVKIYKNHNVATRQQLNSVLLDALCFANLVRNDVTKSPNPQTPTESV